MQLEIGKRYVTRNGMITGKMSRRNLAENSYPWTDGNLIWMSSGDFDIHGKGVFDLVAEYVEEPRIQESAPESQPAVAPSRPAVVQEQGENTDTSNPKDAFGLKKPPLRLIPAAAKLYCARVFGLGAKKYGAYNWRTKDVRLTVYLEAAERHILAKLDGQDLDPESGMPHEAHAMACMAILLDAAAIGKLIDDRPPAGAAAKLIAELTDS
jgi:hypothetical protein